MIHTEYTEPCLYQLYCVALYYIMYTTYATLYYITYLYRHDMGWLCSGSIRPNQKPPELAHACWCRSCICSTDDALHLVDIIGRCILSERMAIYENRPRWHRNYHLSHHIPIMSTFSPWRFLFRSGFFACTATTLLSYQFLPVPWSFMGNAASEWYQA